MSLYIQKNTNKENFFKKTLKKLYNKEPFNYFREIDDDNFYDGGEVAEPTCIWKLIPSYQYFNFTEAATLR